MNKIASANADTLFSRLRGAMPTALTTAKADAATTRGAIGPPASVTLSEAAKAMLEKAKAGQDTASTITRTFDEHVRARTNALSDKLKQAFEDADIPLDEAIDLKIDSTGRITTDGPYKKKIEKIINNNPEFAKEFKDVAGLNAIRAVQKALELYVAEKKAARNDDERAAASDRYTIRSMAIEKASGNMTLKDGKLTSAALDAVTTSSGPAAPQAEAGSSSAATDPLRPGDAGAEIMRRY